MTILGHAPRQNPTFDVVRGVACLLVVVGHARALTMRDYQDSSAQNLLTQTVYALTGLGEQAVLVFFVLSGYWVGGAAVIRLQSGSFDFGRYVIARTTRIYIVLVPAVMVSLLPVWCGLESAIANPESGARSVSSVPDGSWEWNSLWSLASLQPGVVSPPVGNSALWSLGLEFQTYLLFGLILLLVANKSLAARLAATVGLAIILLIVGVGGLGYLLAWIAGVAIRLLPQYRKIPGHAATLAAAAVLFMALLDSTHRFETAGPLGLGIAASSLVYLLACRETGTSSRGPVGVSQIAWLGRWSFSLYAAHLPIMLTAVVLLGLERQAGLIRGFGLMTILVVVAAGLSFVFYQLTEKHTLRVRQTVERLVS